MISLSKQAHLIYWECCFRADRTQLRDTPEVICLWKDSTQLASGNRRITLRGADGLEGEKQHYKPAPPGGSYFHLEQPRNESW